MTNDERTERADDTLTAYCEAVGDQRSAYSDDEAAADLLCDLMHWSKARGLNFSTLLDRAEGNHVEELEEEG